jgi:hypothetical protein
MAKVIRVPERAFRQHQPQRHHQSDESAATAPLRECGRVDLGLWHRHLPDA